MNILARFTLDGVPATGLSPTITVYKVSDNSVVVNAQAMTEIAGGWYKYAFADYSETEEYCFGCDGGATLSGAERYPGGATNTEGTVTVIATDVAGLDGAAMRGTDGAYTGTPPTAEEIREEMDDHSVKLADIVGDTGELQTNQGNWITAIGFTIPGDKMDLVDAPNVTAIAAIQSGLATSSDVSSLNDISVGDLTGSVVEGSITILQAMRIILAVLVGKSSGGGTTAIKFRDTSDSKNRIAATVDAYGNRTAITVDAS